MTEPLVPIPNNDSDALARVLFGLVRNKEEKVKLAFANLVMNRAKFSGKSIWFESNKANQFSINNSDITTPDQSDFQACKKIGDQAIEELEEDPVKGATNFCNKTEHPAWATDLTPSQTIGDYNFYKDIPPYKYQTLGTILQEKDLTKHSLDNLENIKKLDVAKLEILQQNAKINWIIEKCCCWSKSIWWAFFMIFGFLFVTVAIILQIFNILGFSKRDDCFNNINSIPEECFKQEIIENEKIKEMCKANFKNVKVLCDENLFLSLMKQSKYFSAFVFFFGLFAVIFITFGTCLYQPIDTDVLKYEEYLPLSFEKYKRPIS